MIQKPVLLCILDGWGEAPPDSTNAISEARTPIWDSLRADYPYSFLKNWGPDVGLPEGQMGNSEVGHMTLGAGQIILQSLGRINNAINDKSLFDRPALKKLIKTTKSGRTIHLAGLFSTGGVHSHMAHMQALALFFQEKGLACKLHLFLDGRDSSPGLALDHIRTFPPAGIVASLCGRYFAMDRDNNHDRTLKAARLIKKGEAERKATNAEEAIAMLYQDNIGDEFAPPVNIGDYQGMEEGDSLIITNFRADRIRQLIQAIANPPASGNDFPPNPVLSMMPCWKDARPWHKALFPPAIIAPPLGDILAQHKIPQFRIAETEKYAHVTFFFNGGREDPFPGEKRHLVPSSKVATHDLKPEMAAGEITEKLCEAVLSKNYGFILANFANPDMLGHTGKLKPAIKAIEAVDNALGKIVTACRKSHTRLIITADHGNAETMFDYEARKPHTAHTTNPVPFLYCAEDAENYRLEDGILADVAPTILSLLDLPPPDHMTGRVLINLEE